MLLIFFETLTDEQNNLIEKIFKDYNIYFKKISFGILKSESDAEDAVSMSYIKIMDNIERISALSCPQMTAFCVSIVKHTSIDLIRREVKKAYDNEDRRIEEQLLYNLEDEVTSKFDKEELVKKIRELPYEEQLLLQMRYADEMKYSEIAEILNISEETAKKRGQRIVSKLRKMYEGEVW